MNHDTFAAFRAMLLAILILALIGCCIVEAAPTDEPEEIITATTREPEPTTTAPERATAPTIDLQKTSEETPMEETEPATIAMEPATEHPSEPSETWKSLGTFTLTAYCSCKKCCGYWATIRPTDKNGDPIVYTATGAVAKAGTTIAVDPRVIPYGSEVQINGHTYIAQDTGGAIKNARIDVYFDDHQEACEFGRQQAEVFVKMQNL